MPDFSEHLRILIERLSPPPQAPASGPAPAHVRDLFDVRSLSDIFNRRLQDGVTEKRAQCFLAAYALALFECFPLLSPPNAFARLDEMLHATDISGRGAEFVQAAEWLKAAQGAMRAQLVAGSKSADDRVVQLLSSFHVDGNCPALFSDEFPAEEFLRELLACEVKGVFHKEVMHDKFGVEDWRRWIGGIVKSTQELIRKDKGVSVVVFVDEANTTRIQGYVAEAFLNHTLDGEQLPRNMFFVGAINKNKPAPADQVSAFNATGLVEETSHKEYIVQLMAPALESLEADFGELSGDVEAQFIAQIVEDRVMPVLRDKIMPTPSDMSTEPPRCDIAKMKSWGNQVRAIISFAQDFVRSAKLERVKVSLRDIVRAVSVYVHAAHSNSPLRSFLSTFARQDQTPLVGQNLLVRIHERAILLSLGICYFHALPRDGANAKLRDQFICELQRVLDRERLPAALMEVFDKEVSHVYKQMDIPLRIIETKALSVNLFVVAVCVQIGIPVVVSGPPGCSKTLSFNIIANSMRGHCSDAPPLRKMVKVNRMGYQCSEDSSASEIQMCFVRAVSRQKELSAAGTSDRVVVFLDEAGLPAESKQALKAIHSFLDHPEVGCVILANSTLDAAKTNRCVRVLHEATSKEDLLTMTRGFLETSLRKRGLSDSALNSVIRGIVISYENVVSKKVLGIDMYHQRDFVFFLRAFSGYLDLGDWSIEKALSHALERNLNASNPQDFEALRKSFASKINTELLSSIDAFRLNSFPPARPPLECLKEAILARVGPNEDPNTAALRYVLVIDPTGTDSCVRHLLDAHVLDPENTTVVRVSDFADDTTELSRSRLVGQVKMAMALGKTTAMQNVGPLETHFYDVFNRHFQVVFGETGVKHFANIAIGSFTRLCLVDPRFQVVVVIPEQSLRRTPLPFLNRFEKYRLTSKDVLDYKKGNHHIPFVHNSFTAYDLIVDNMTGFVSHLGLPTFYGYVKEETEFSYALSVLTDSKHKIPHLVDPLSDSVEFPDLNDSHADESNLESAQLQFAVEASLRQLMWVAQPHLVFRGRHLLEDDRVQHYLKKQEHLSLVTFFEKLRSQRDRRKSANSSVATQKWIVYIGSSTEVSRLLTDKGQSECVFGKLSVVLSMSSFTSSQNLDFQLKLFFESAELVTLVLLADVRLVSSQQINLARE